MNKLSSKNKNALLAFTTAALALPGMTSQTVTAQTAAEGKTLSYRYSQYGEGDFEGNLGRRGDRGVTQRYDISVHQLRFKSAIASNADVTIDFLQEAMTGASPAYIIEGTDGAPIVVFSGATIEEQRTGIDANFTTYFDSIISSTSLSYSTENDYNSFSMTYALSKLLNDKNVTLDFAVSGSQDFIEPVIEVPNVDRERKTSGSLSIGVSTLIDKTSIIAAGLNFTQYEGYLSDPYKSVEIQNIANDISENASLSCTGRLCKDNRPDQRSQWALSSQYRKSMVKYNAALHLNYRYFSNNWEVDSHTLEAAWYQNFKDTWQIAPEIRYYVQSEAAFYQMFFEDPRNDGFYSSDYRLSPFESLSLKLKLTKFLKFGALHASYETYDSKEKSGRNALSSGSPTLVDFSHFTIGIDYKF